MRRTKSQRLALEQSWKNNPYPTKSDLQRLSSELDLSENQAFNWFKMRRQGIREGKFSPTSRSMMKMPLKHFMLNV